MRSRIVYFSQIYNAKVEKQVYDGNLQDKYCGNTEHKLYVLCFVANYLHADEHGHTAAKCGQNKQSFFGCAKLNSVLF